MSKTLEVEVPVCYKYLYHMIVQIVRRNDITFVQEIRDLSGQIVVDPFLKIINTYVTYIGKEFSCVYYNSIYVRKEAYFIILRNKIIPTAFCFYKYINNMAQFSEPPLVQHQLCYLTRALHSCHL